MIARTWHARLTPGREADYETFAATQSMPMFSCLPGCRGVLFLGEGIERRVLSVWSDAGAIEALSGDPDYLAVSRRLAESGILASSGPVNCEPASGEVFPPPAPAATAGTATPGRPRQALR